jgi:hypothetical protein
LNPENRAESGEESAESMNVKREYGINGINGNYGKKPAILL